MRYVFSEKAPTLKLTAMKSRSQKDEQNGYRDIFAGGMTGIRNPRAHEHSLEDDPVEALEMLTLANHLMGKLHASTRARRRKSRK